MKSILQSLARALAVGLIAIPIAATAQTYPTKPVKFIVPFAPGGATDISARILGQKLGEMWGQTIVVENRGGAAGNIGGAEAAKATPDGYTLFFTSGSVVTANEHIYPNMPFNPARDFVAVTNVVRGPQVIAVPANSPYQSLQDLLAAAKANPGKLNYGHAGVGSQTHLAAENFLYTAKVDMQHVPYKGEGPAVADLVAGQINMATPNLAGFENYGWFGIVAPAGTPKDILDKVYRDSVKALDSPEMRGRFFVQGMSIVANSPADFEKAMRDERARWATVVKERNISVSVK
jgi:tripartite-type tricarboxylate transporter receptor subunit TctC